MTYEGAAKYDLIIDRRASFSRTFTIYAPSGDPVNLTGFQGEADIKTKGDNSEVIYTFSTEGDNPRMLLGGVAGTITIFMEKSETAELPLQDLEWDLRQTNPSDTEFDGNGKSGYILYGNVYPNNTVTESDQ